MTTHSRGWNEVKYRQYLDEGRGQGLLSSYKPWIMVQDFPSRGKVSRVLGFTTGRIHHLLSNHELWYFYLLDWSEHVCDIREQYPLLELDRVLVIADKAGIRYPYDKKSGFPYVLTSDFLITTKTGECVRTIKQKNDLQKKRVREKLELERRYWLEKGIDWKVVTEDEINCQKAMNIEWIFRAAQVNGFNMSKEHKSYCLDFFEAVYRNSTQSVVELIELVERELKLTPGSGIYLFKYLIFTKRIEYPLERPMDLTAVRKKENDIYGAGNMQKPDLLQ